MRRIMKFLKPIKRIQFASHCLTVILFSATAISTAYAVNMEPPKCDFIADECWWMDGSFQHCFDNFRIPDGELSPIGATIQVDCTKNIIVCDAKIVGGDRLSCFSSVPPASAHSLNFPLTVTPNEVCRAFNLGVAKNSVSVVYKWCPKSMPH